MSESRDLLFAFLYLRRPARKKCLNGGAARGISVHHESNRGIAMQTASFPVQPSADTLGARPPVAVADAYLTADDVCRILRISLATLRRRVRDRKFPRPEARCSAAEHRRWRVSVLNEFITKTPGG